MKIIRPLDWQYCEFADLTVIVEDVYREDLWCVLWTRDNFFSNRQGESYILKRAPLIVIEGTLAAATMTDLEPWLSCVIGVVTPDLVTLITASGVNLARSNQTRWLMQRHDSSVTSSTAQVSFPLQLVHGVMSHHPGDVLTTCDSVADIGSLLSSRRVSVCTAPFFAAERVDAGQSILYDQCIGMDHPAAIALMAGSIYDSSPSYLARFGPSYVELPQGLVVFGDRKLWSDSTVTSFVNDPTLTKVPRMFKSDEKLGIAFDHKLNKLGKRNLLSWPTMRGIPMIITNVFYRNHAHWLINCLFPVFLLKDNINNGEISVLVPEKTKYIEDTISSVGIDVGKTILAPAGSYYFEDVLYSSCQSTHNNYYPHPALRLMFEHIRATCLASGHRPGPERIYVTRIGSGTLRHISNEIELIASLEERGFTVIAPHELSFNEEVICFASARVVIGQLGAGLINVGFAPPGCVVIEITSHNYVSNDYAMLSHICGHQFVRLLFESASKEEHRHRTDFEFEVLLDPTLAAVDSILSKDNA